MKNDAKDINNNELTDILQVEGVNSKGYGIIPKLVMQDPRLSPEAKCIYAYFCSYAGAGSQAFPSVSLILNHLGMSKTRYYSHISLLKQCGYIRTEQLKHNGKFTKTIYTLCTNPRAIPLEPVENKEISPCPSFKDTEENTEKPCPSFVDTQIVDTQNWDSNINSSLKLTVFKNNNQSINQQENKKVPATDINQSGKTEKQIQQESNAASGSNGADEVIYNLEYLHSQFKPGPQELEEQDPMYNELVELIHDVVNSKVPKIKVNGDNLPSEVVRSRFLKLTSAHLKCVIENFKQQTVKINNVRAYLITALYNSYTSASGHYNNQELQKAAGDPERSAPRGLIPQNHNFKQREYEDSYYDSLYENS